MTGGGYDHGAPAARAGSDHHAGIRAGQERAVPERLTPVRVRFANFELRASQHRSAWNLGQMRTDGDFPLAVEHVLAV
jgi:hypothetical protein